MVSDRGIWLDKLPDEVCQRIAAHVCGCQQNPDILALAKTSSVLRKAALALLRNRLIIPDKKSVTEFRLIMNHAEQRNQDVSTLCGLIRLMGEDIFELDQGLFCNPLRHAVPSSILPLFSLPYLRVVEIMDCPAQVAAVSRSSSIQELRLLLRHQMQPKQLFSAVAKLHLMKLKMMCMDACVGVCRKQLCPWQDPDVIGSDLQGFARFLPHLTSIDVRCDCLTRDIHHHLGMSMFWKVLPSLKTLKEISFCWHLPEVAPPKETLQFLSSREVVRVVNTRDAYHLASLIGLPVVEISSQHSFLLAAITAKELLDLRNHPRLRVLGIRIDEGSEKALPEVVQGLPELRKLDLLWMPGILLRDICRYTGQCYATAMPGVMLRAVQVAPQLSSLCIVRVRIALTELLTIMKSIGLHLREFETSLGDQEEAPFERLEKLLLGAARYNTELRKFFIEDVGHEPGPILEWKWEEQAQRVLARLWFLRRVAPYLSVGNLEEDVLRTALLLE